VHACAWYLRKDLILRGVPLHGPVSERPERTVVPVDSGGSGWTHEVCSSPARLPGRFVLAARPRSCGS